ncbi:MAG: peptide chain release factor 1 [Rhodobacterales bacterium 32-67-9]|nr:MAG: peptide chain release factor 1 [Rhodobacterales bacterium 32-67-9]
MVPLDKLAQITRRFEFLEAKLSAGAPPAEIAALSREYSELKPVVAEIAAYRQALADLDEAEAMLADPEMRALAEDELPRLKERIPEMEGRLRIALLPKDAADARPAILEIRPGTGGEEAALFAGALLRMYQKHAESQGWRFELMELSETELGGVKEAMARIEGEGVFARLKFESGVHRVQRVPETEAGGRIHTSAATVAVLPEAEEVEIDVTSSEKSQHQNRANAMAVLRARLYDLERSKADDARAADRKAQVGSGDRSERIRTYNFPQGRMTDHRINLTLYRLDQIMAGDLTEVIDALVADDQASRLAELDA